MARVKKITVEPTHEELEMMKQKKLEQKEKIFKDCVLKESHGYSKSEISKFMKMCDELKVTQGDLIHLAISALLNDKIEFETETKTTLILK